MYRPVYINSKLNEMELNGRRENFLGLELVYERLISTAVLMENVTDESLPINDVHKLCVVHKLGLDER